MSQVESLAGPFGAGWPSRKARTLRVPSSGMLVMGAKHVDGTPFGTPERRPHQLQIPPAPAG